MNAQHLLNPNIQNKVTIENESTSEPTFVRKNKATFGVAKDKDENSFVLPSISVDNRHSILDTTFNNVVPDVSQKVHDPKDYLDKRKLKNKISMLKFENEKEKENILLSQAIIKRREWMQKYRISEKIVF